MIYKTRNQFHVLPVCIGRTGTGFLPVLQEVRRICKTCNQFNVITRLLCFGWQEANRHLAITIDCLANNEVKRSSARCPSSRHL
jgi:hypothetical protein